MRIIAGIGAVLLAAALGLCVGNAQAVLVRVDYTAVVNTAECYRDPLISAIGVPNSACPAGLVGQAASGYFIYDHQDLASLGLPGFYNEERAYGLTFAALGFSNPTGIWVDGIGESPLNIAPPQSFSTEILVRSIPALAIVVVRPYDPVQFILNTESVLRSGLPTCPFGCSLGGTLTSFSTSAIPEPGTLALLAVGAGILGARRRRSARIRPRLAINHEEL